MRHLKKTHNEINTRQLKKDVADLHLILNTMSGSSVVGAASLTEGIL